LRHELRHRQIDDLCTLFCIGPSGYSTVHEGRIHTCPGRIVLVVSYRKWALVAYLLFPTCSAHPLQSYIIDTSYHKHQLLNTHHLCWLVVVSSMAPGLTDVQASVSPTLDRRSLRETFPDGIKTSGQQSPVYDELRLYDDFPDEITGPTIWKAEDYSNNPERWTHHFTEEEVAEMSEAADKFKAAALPLTGISKVRCPKSANRQ
jgi:hypothetical protein